MAKQFSFQGKEFKKPNPCFGGSLLKGNPKTKRPLESKLPIHLTLRSNQSAMRLPKTFQATNEIVYKTAKKHGIKIYEYANVGNHLHILIKVPRVKNWAGFIRELTGRIAYMMKALGITAEKFWRYRPHTRIVQGWRKPFKIAKDYIDLNFLEAEGFISRKQTKTLKDLRLLLEGRISDA